MPGKPAARLTDMTASKFLCLVLLALSICGCSGSSVLLRKTYPFSVIPFNDFDIEQQSLQTGLGEENFHIIVPDGGKMDEIWITNGHLKRKKISLDDYRVGTNYVTASTQGGFYLFMGSGASYFNKDATRQIWHISMDEQFSGWRLAGPAYALPDGSAVVFLSFNDSKADKDELELVRFEPSSKKMQTLVSLPVQLNQSILERFYLPNGFIAARWSKFKGIGIVGSTKFYGLDGKPYDHPLAKAISTLHKNKIDLRDYNFYPSQTKDAWGIFYQEQLAQFPDKHLFLLSVTDTTQATPVVAERNSLKRQGSLSYILIHPNLNLFVLGVKQDDSIVPYLGHVRKDGNVYRAETYRLRPFPEMEHTLFSRNGQVLLFSTRMNEQTNFVFSRLEDLLSDVNRRYPEAKLDLDALKAEVK